jgi:excisionase family DNA binding protein
MHSDPRTTLAPDAPQLIDRLQAARVLGVSPGTVENLRLRGELPSLKIGARRLFDRADIAAFIAARKVVQP